MDQTRADLRDPYSALEELARIALSGERRLQRLERLFRWTAALFVLTLALALYALAQGFGAAPAQAEARLGWPHVAPEVLPEQLEPDAGRKVHEPPADFHSRIEALRSRVTEAGDDEMNPFHALAVILNDIRGELRETRTMLAVMPQMGEDLGHVRGDLQRIAGTMESMEQKMAGIPLMAEDMRRLSTSIDIMTTSIDSTMGRMGRMMPYFW
jgi:hypothetical protein